MQISNFDKASDIKKAAFALGRDRCSYNVTPSSAPYLFSTENLVDTYKKLNPKNKNILTVAASGDHAFDAYLNGAQHVETFDFNLLQECVMRLKTDLIHYMTYGQFMNFFFNTLQSGKIYESYNIISPFMSKLSPEAAALMTQFYDVKTDKKQFFKPTPFYNLNTRNFVFKRTNIQYIQSQATFNKLKKRLPERIDFTLADVTLIAKNLSNSYDIIHLSNISDYLPDSFNTILQPLFNHLSPGGTMVINYGWNKTKKDNQPEHATTIPPTDNKRFYNALIPSSRKDIKYDMLTLVQKVK